MAKRDASTLRPNVGGYDRLGRVVAGTVLLAVAAVGFTDGQGGLALLSLAVAAGLLVTAATQFCGVNALLGVDTRSREADGER